MHLQKRGTSEHRVMIGILYGAKNNLLMNCMRENCNPTRKLTISGIGMNYARRIILLEILKSIKNNCSAITSKAKPNPTISIRKLTFFLQNISFLLTSLKKCRRLMKGKIFGLWNLQANHKEREFSCSINFHRYPNGKIIKYFIFLI